MGVNGFELLDLATANKTPAVMLTAHALTPESFQKSIDKGAVSFLPKDELARLNELVAEILGEVQEEQNALAETGRKGWGPNSKNFGASFGMRSNSRLRRRFLGRDG